MKKTIIVMCQRRSGSSMLSGILHKLGISMVYDPYDETKKNKFNTTGYFEDMAMIKCSEYILRGLTDIPRMKELIGRRNTRDIWGFKDVNLIETWEKWNNLVRNPIFIYINRDSDKIADSFINWHGGSRKHVKNTIEGNKSRLRQYYKEKGGLWLEFEDIISNKRDTIDKIIDFTGIKPTREQKLDAFNHIKNK